MKAVRPEFKPGSALPPIHPKQPFDLGHMDSRAFSTRRVLAGKSMCHRTFSIPRTQPPTHCKHLPKWSPKSFYAFQISLRGQCPT